jgi:hypothetical protein
MKINEINQPKQIDESLAGALFGEVPMAALKGLFTGKGGKHQLAQDIFLRDFYQDALTSLDNGIKSGYVDPKKAYAPNPTTNANADTNADANTNANAQPQQFMGKAAPDVRPATKPADPFSAPTLAQPGKTVNTRVGTPSTPGSITTGGPGAPARPGTPAAPARPSTPATPGSITTGGPGAPAAPGTPATAPTPGPKPAPAPTPGPGPKPAPAPAPTSASGSPIFTGAPKKADFTQAKMDLRSAIAADPRGPMIDSQSQRKMIDNIVRNGSTVQQEIERYLKNSPSSVKNRTSESRYSKLNAIFEGMISEMDGAGEATISITDHMLEWFGLYMTGVNWESKKAAIIPQLKKIQDTYGTDKGKAAIKNLAKFAYSISGKGGQIPKGAENAVQSVTNTAVPSKKNSPEQLAADLIAQPANVQDKIIKQVKDARSR